MANGTRSWITIGLMAATLGSLSHTVRGDSAGRIGATNTEPPSAITADGGRYYGPLVDGKQHGTGRIEWDNGARYEGEFVHGLFAGRGRKQSAEGTRYEGEFASGMAAGQGRVDTSHGDVYVGSVRAGTYWGQGTLTFADGRTYTGEFERGKFHGQGRFQTPLGETYEGQFVRGEFSGTGVYTNRIGVRHEGMFQKWRPTGRGALTDPAGNVFEGEFTNGLIVGHGVKRFKDGSRYEGDFKQWNPEGKGVLVHANGDRYEGSFAGGMYHGEGTLRYAKPSENGATEQHGRWQHGTLADPEREERTRRDVEQALYGQRALLDQALARLQPSDPQRINLYLLAIGGDGSQEVFRREVQYVQNRFDRDFGTRGRSIALANSRTTVESVPMATITSIDTSLRAIAYRMDRDKDVLFLFLTSHGSHDFHLTLGQNGMDLRDLAAAELGGMLRKSAIRWKVIVVSACYSGGFIDALKDEHTLIITAARHDRTSFGCTDDNDFTYFGRAFFAQGLDANTSFRDAFDKARVLVHEWETKDAKGAARDGKPAQTRHSMPQIHTTPAIEAQLARWREQLIRQPTRSALSH